MHIPLLVMAGIASSILGTAVIDREAEVTGDHIQITVDPNRAGTITRLTFTGSTHNLAAAGGLLQEGFGVGSFYVPNRRINERLEILDDLPERPVLRFSYDGDGPNISGLHVTRIIEPIRDEASFRVTWQIENRGTQAHWIAPWSRSHVAPGGSVEDYDRIDVPTIGGVRRVTSTGYFLAARNWIAVTDPKAKETVYAVFQADTVHAFKSIVDPSQGILGFEAAFVPLLLEPGQTWETTFRIGAVKGLTHVDFATDEMALQLDYEQGELKVLMSAATTLEDVEMRATILDHPENPTRLRTKRFSIAPDKLVRSTYAWVPPKPGEYDFLAEFTRNGRPYRLGRDTEPPHGGIDTRIVLGTSEQSYFEPWTDAPFALQRGPRTLQRTLAQSGDTIIWFESPLNKIFRRDVAEPVGRADPTARMVLAKNERESIQLVLHPKEGHELRSVQLRFSDLTHAATGFVIPRSLLRAYRVAYVPVRVPSHYENPTGDYPDPLYELTPFTASGGESHPIWITFYAPPGTPEGRYQGTIEILSSNADPVELWLEITVMDFELPAAPFLKTDFGFEREWALDESRRLGFSGTLESLQDAYRRNAFEHRVSLRQLIQLPAEAVDYKAALAGFESRWRSRPENPISNASVIAVPPSLLNMPEQLRLANEFVVSHGLQDRVYSPMGSAPARNSWPALIDRLTTWREIAPDIPVSITTFGLDPFLAEACDIWTVHSPVFDTPNNRTILSKIAEGREVWWYIDHEPPRPYGNFFLDFDAIEHRILFWQAWALGIRGFHYASVNAAAPNQDPFQSQLDATPVNGNGFLLYPGRDGPVNSIRWETIRDGIEDYDYLKLLMARIATLRDQGLAEAVLAKAAQATKLNDVIPNLVTFTRDPAVLQNKRLEIATAIVELGKLLAP